MKTATIVKMESCIEDLQEKVKNQIGDSVYDMNTEEFELFKSLFEMIDVAKEFMTEIGESIQNIDRKLDELAKT